MQISTDKIISTGTRMNSPQQDSGGPEPLCSCWQSPIVHTYTNSCHQCLTGTPLGPLAPSSLHGFLLRNTNTFDPQAISPASLAQYLLNLIHSSCAFVRSYTFVLPQVACTTWASEPWSHSRCWHLDLHTYTRIIEKSLERIFSNKKQSLLSTMHSHKSALNSKLYISNQPILFIFFSVFSCVFPSHLDPSLHLWFFT